MMIPSSFIIAGKQVVASGSAIVETEKPVEIHIGEEDPAILEVAWEELEGKPENGVTIVGIGHNKRRLTFINRRGGHQYIITNPLRFGAIEDQQAWLKCCVIEVAETPKTVVLFYQILIGGQ